MLIINMNYVKIIMNYLNNFYFYFYYNHDIIKVLLFD